MLGDIVIGLCEIPTWLVVFFFCCVRFELHCNSSDQLQIVSRFLEREREQSLSFNWMLALELGQLFRKLFMRDGRYNFTNHVFQLLINKSEPSRTDQDG